MRILNNLRDGKTFKMGIEVHSFRSEIQRVKDFVTELLQTCYEDEMLDRLILAFDEIITNAYEHGNLEISKEEKVYLVSMQIFEDDLERRERKFGHRRVRVEICLSKDKCLLVVEDEGSGFDWQNELYPPRASSSKVINLSGKFSGHGLLLIKKMVDSLLYSETGNRCEISKFLKLK
ncbi:MAG TPA: ATP-binding protein [Oligoflexia bacterium]|nr:ATP-binding protein [Oligoflexia bacterium]HMP48102.1 ATP-binding protein [Oligoflexia bacterium]